MDNIEERKKLDKESRVFYDKFHWQWTILAGGALTVFFNFIRYIDTNDHVLKIYIKFGIFSILSALILSPIRNLLSNMVTNSFANLITSNNREERKRIVKTVKIEVFFTNVSALLSIFLLPIGFIFFAYALTEIYLK